MKFLTNEAEEDQKIRAGSGNQKARKGYIGHIVYLCRKIKELSTKNTVLAKLAESKFIFIQGNNSKRFLRP